MRAGRTAVATATLALLVLGGAAAAHAAGSCGKGGPTGGPRRVTFDPSYYVVSTPTAYTDARPWPLLLDLHGDGGNPESQWDKRWGTTVLKENDFLFVAPMAPYAGGSWYKDVKAHEAWFDKLMARLLSDYNVDLDRIWIWGGSGGATFMGGYVMKRQELFAAAHFNECGAAWAYAEPASPQCRTPARFATSTGDHCRGEAQRLYLSLMSRGHETEWIDAPCSGHCIDNATSVTNGLAWFRRHTLCGSQSGSACGRAGTPSPQAPGTEPDAGTAGPATDAATGTPPAGTDGPGATAPGAPPPSPTADTQATGGCTYAPPSAPARPTPALIVVLALLALAMHGRRRRSTHARHRRVRHDRLAWLARARRVPRPAGAGDF